MPQFGPWNKLLMSNNIKYNLKCKSVVEFYLGGEEISPTPTGILRLYVLDAWLNVQLNIMASSSICFELRVWILRDLVWGVPASLLVP